MQYDQVLDFWFGEIIGDVTRENRDALWFGGGEETDNQIKQQFQAQVSLAGEGKLSHWTETAKGTLAHIILLDQFTRNLYRGLSAAFRYDEFALAICKKGLANGKDVELSAIERVFFYLPLEHSEHLEDQEESLFRFNQLKDSVAPQHQAVFEGYCHHAKVHHDVVKQFGRFPHRNACKGRLSTQTEIDWLAEGGKRFGQ